MLEAERVSLRWSVIGNRCRECNQAFKAVVYPYQIKKNKKKKKSKKRFNQIVNIYNNSLFWT